MEVEELKNLMSEYSVCNFEGTSLLWKKLLVSFFFLFLGKILDKFSQNLNEI